MQTYDILGTDAPYAARTTPKIFDESHTSTWWVAGNNLMTGEDVRRMNIEKDN